VGETAIEKVRKTETVIEEKKAKTKAYRKVKGLTNSECRSLEIP